MPETKRRLILITIAEVLYALALFAWFIEPLILSPGVNGLIPALLAWQIVPDPSAGMPMFILIFAMVWLIPAIGLWKIASVFLTKKLPSLASPSHPMSILLDIVSSGFVLAIQVIHALTFAKGVSYLASLYIGLVAMLVASIAWNAYSIVRFIHHLGHKDENWQLYRNFRQNMEEEKVRLHTRLLRWGIQKRLVFSFVTIIFLIIITLCGVLLSDFSKTLLDAVNQNGKTLAERTASIVKTSFGDNIAIDDYLGIEALKNRSSSLYPFNSLSYYARNPATNNFTLVSGTDQKLIGKRMEYSADLQLSETTFREINQGTAIEFLSPIRFGSKYVGLISAIYDKEIILEPYFRTQTKVFIIALVAIYFSIFITYLFGRNIVIPILFLRMSVNNISTTLGQMIRGDRKISADGLHYLDIVATRDEIKGLSLEIGNMTTVIRGVLPYVSASTLRHSERAHPSTEKRDLAFLFTDIRGFTTLCEGLEPDEVVTMLNQYLELQSSIIMKNGGDIDKFVGDEIMAMFEGPEKNLNACKAAMEIAQAMADERAKAEAAKGRVINIGIGINSGPVVFGSVGARDRMDFTSIGDTVNLAARLEGANKIYGTKTLISEAVHSQISESLLCREIDLMTVKGKSQPVRIYEILGTKADASKTTVKLCESFTSGLSFYRKQNWDKAEKIFTTLFAEYQDEPSKVFLDRVAAFRSRELPKNWDGVFNLTIK